MKTVFNLFILFLLTGLFTPAAAERSPAWPVEKSTKLPNGITLHYVEQGDTGGIPVIFLHGITDSWHSYERVLPLLPKTIHAYALSERGHGNSTKPLTGFRPEDFAEDLALFMKHHRIGEAVIVGHSMSSTITQCFAVRHPELVRSVVLVGAFADYNTELMTGFVKELATLKDPIDRKYAEEFQKSTLYRPVPPAYFETVVDESMKAPARVWYGVMSSFLKVNYLSGLRAFRKPTLVIWGEKDTYALRNDQDLLQKAIPGSKLLIYEETGHAVHWEDPERFVRDLLDFTGQ
ncbi:alpha/beta fold hydrolase [Larkinella soli]|uniref:alpha/beta fold hydrolase n=1 Tax=Larkinella soli TaxID=1770527 RepID=UPI0013E370BB|nr:alpha/beta hydrolase [Larkinella soli]